MESHFEGETVGVISVTLQPNECMFISKQRPWAHITYMV